MKYEDENGTEYSPDKKYRYTLWRTLDDKRLHTNAFQGSVAFIGLNPSDTTNSDDDPTVKKCYNYAKKWGFNKIYMLNLFACRTAKSKDVKDHPNPVGPENVGKILEISKMVDCVIGCWGSHGTHLDQDKKIYHMLKLNYIKVRCLGITKDGHPKHPLYMKKNTAPKPFKGYKQMER